MAIIVEIKSTRTCCRKNILKEGALDSAIDFISSGTNSAAMAIRTQIQKVAAEAIIEQLTGKPVSEETKDTIIYKSVLETIAMVDAKDVLGLLRGDEDVCDTIAANTASALIKVVNNEIVDELGDIADDAADKIGAGSVISKVVGFMQNVEKPLAAMAAEKIKELPELKQLSSKICQIEFMDIIKDIPGAQTLLGFFGGDK
tara:strand:+ start:110 stop:712 length:603 start_codon:yes stop_codon:yes gene_type:complete